MRNWTFIFILLLSNSVFSQQKIFDLADTTFQKGATHILPPLTYTTCYNIGNLYYNQNKELIDSLTDFFIKNPNLTIEISSHSDQRGSTKTNLMLTQKKAKNLRIILLDRGLKESQFTTIGSGESEPIIKQDVIDKLNTKDEKGNAYKTNRRLELKILKTKN